MIYVPQPFLLDCVSFVAFEVLGHVVSDDRVSLRDACIGYTPVSGQREFLPCKVDLAHPGTQAA
jgi:hypothetical protein